jgi:hypothetical protein
MTTANSYQRNGFTVEIWYDEDATSPRDQYDPVSGLVMWGRNYNFPNDAGMPLPPDDGFGSWSEVAERLMKPYAVFNEEADEDHDFVLDRFATWEEARRHIDGPPRLMGDGYVIDAAWDDGPALLVLPVWVYDHSSISFSAGSRSWPYDDRWDSAQAGVAYLTAAHWRNLKGEDAVWTGSEEEVDFATKLLQREVTTYGQYVNGEVYGFTITDWDGEVIGDPCGDIIGYEFAEEEANMEADNAGHTVKCTGTLCRASGEVEHDGPCPVHNLIMEES